MNKISVFIAVLCASAAFAVNAETTTAAPPSTTTAPVATSSPAATPAAKPAANGKQKNTSSEHSNSFYDTVKSGWNSFIDVLTGPSTQSK